PEGAAVKGAGHVKDPVAVLPTPVPERNQHLIFRHKPAVEPGDAAIRWLRHGRDCYLTRSSLVTGSETVIIDACRLDHSTLHEQRPWGENSHRFSEHTTHSASISTFRRVPSYRSPKSSLAPQVKESRSFAR